MRDKNRIPKIMGLVAVIWMDYPDMRFGQLYENLIGQYCVDHEIPPIKAPTLMWNFEDDEFIEYLQNFKGF